MRKLDLSEDLREVWKIYFDARVLSMAPRRDAELHRVLLASVDGIRATLHRMQYLHEKWKVLDKAGDVEPAEQAKLRWLDSRRTPAASVYTSSTATSHSLGSVWHHSSIASLPSLACSMDDDVASSLPHRGADLRGTEEEAMHRATEPSASKALPKYRYENLTADNDAFKIRLVTFAPDRSATGHVRCSISTVDFAKTATMQRYQAVSYAWGTAELRDLLICDDDSACLPITSRLHSTLVRLRNFAAVLSSAEPIRFWIDAISINQSDKIEKARQVPRMAEIFKRASFVHIFLSDGTDCSSWLQSEWFTRRWVVQELLAARNIYVHLPNKDKRPRRIDWKCLMQRFDAQLDYETANLDSTTVATIKQFQTFKDSPSSSFNIITLLNSFQHAACRDDRDRIFSFMAISSDVQSHDSPNIHYGHKILFEADYTTSIEETYKRFALAALHSSQPFEILQCAGAFRSSTSGENWRSTSRVNEGHILFEQVSALIDLPIKPEHCARPKAKHFLNSGSLPSWVPDWRYTSLYEIDAYNSSHKAGIDMSAKRGSFVCPELEEDGLTIRLTGHMIGRVESFGFEPKKRNRMTAESQDTYTKTAAHKSERVEIVTDTVMHGTAPPATKIGDVIVLFQRARTLFVLRPCFNWKGYRLVGDCIMPQIMDGKLAHEATKSKSEFLII
jgi:hypothetical protein